MSAANVPEAVAGFLLVFFVPGYTLTKATFPEWRIRGASATRRLVEVVTLSFVLSVVLTVLVGYLLLSAAPGGFQASWSDPVLEAALAAVALVGGVAGWARGAYSRTVPSAPRREAEATEEDAWEVSREIDRLNREERRLLHDLRGAGPDGRAAGEIRSALESVRAERDALQRRREGEFLA